MATRILQMPASRQHVIIPKVQSGDRLVFAFPPEQVFAERADQDLVLARHDGSRLTLRDFYAHPELPLPVIQIHSRAIPGEDFLAQLDQEDMPNAGHVPPAAAGRFHEYSNDALLQGIDALGPLDAQHRSMSEENHLREAFDRQAPTGNMGVGPTVNSFREYVTEDQQTISNGNVLAGSTPGTEPDMLIWTSAASSKYGIIQLNADGSYMYALNNALQNVQALGAGEQAEEQFTYIYTDALGQQAKGVLSIIINGTNDLPTVAASTALITEETSDISGTLPTPHDVDAHDTLSFVPFADKAGQYGTLTINADGSYIYTLNNSLASVQNLGVGDKLTDTFNYTVTDEHGGTGTNTLIISINGTNDIPTVAASVASIGQNSEVLSGTLPTPHDVDVHDTVDFEPFTNKAGTYGTLTVHTDGSYIYMLDNTLSVVQDLDIGATLTETFTYTVTDHHGGTASSTLTVTIHGTNDAPSIAAATNSATEDTEIIVTGTLPAPHDVNPQDTVMLTPFTNKAGNYGTLTLNSDGTYSYTLNNMLVAVQSLSAGDKLTDIFTYTVTDNHGATGSNTLTITINGTNDAPTVAAAVDSVTEDTKIIATGTLPTLVDADSHDTLAFTPLINKAGQYGTLNINADGTYTYTLNNTLAAVQALGVGEQIIDTFIYTGTDNHGASASNTLTITINGTNDAPTAFAATASVTEDTKIIATGTLPALVDTESHDTLAFTPLINKAGQYGTLTINADGTYTYTLNNTLAAVQALGVGEQITDIFSYTATDMQGTTATNTLTVTINGTNDAPTVAASTAAIAEDTPSISGTLVKAVDVDTHDTLTFIPQVNKAGQYGTLTLSADGTYTYTLNNTLGAVQALGLGDKLTETFTYTVKDNHGATASNTLALTINGVNNAPIADPTRAELTEDTQIIMNGHLLTHDPDSMDSISFVPIVNKDGLYGKLTVNTDGSCTYILNNSMAAVQELGVGETLSDIFTYSVLDQHGASASSTLNIIINGTNDVPTVAAFTTSIMEDAVAVSGALPTPHDVDIHDTVTFVPQTGKTGAYGTLNVNADGTYTYTLNNTLPAVQHLSIGDTLTDTFNYTITDTHGGTATNVLTVTINGTNDAPTADPSTVFTVKYAPAVSVSLPTPVDVDDHDTVSYTASNQTGNYGTLAIYASGLYTYTLNKSLPIVKNLGAGDKLVESFTYTVVDNHGAAGSNTITITINGAANHAPTVAAAIDNVTEDIKVSTTGTLPTPQDVDISDILTFIPLTNKVGSYGTLTLNASGAYTYTLSNSMSAVQALGMGETLTDTFIYTATDNHGGTVANVLTVTINGTNDAPTVAASTASVTEDTKLTATGTLATPVDVDIHDTVSFTPLSNKAGHYGTLTLNANGSYTYTLSNGIPAVQALGTGEKLTDTFSYTVTDNHGLAASNTLTVTINGTNDAPTVAAAVNSVTEDNKIRASGTLPKPVDVDAHDTVTFENIDKKEGSYGSLTVNDKGIYAYVLHNNLKEVQDLNIGDTLTDRFTYTVKDNHGGTGSNILTITIMGGDSTICTTEPVALHSTEQASMRMNEPASASLSQLIATEENGMPLSYPHNQPSSLSTEENQMSLNSYVRTHPEFSTALQESSDSLDTVLTPRSSASSSGMDSETHRENGSLNAEQPNHSLAGLESQGDMMPKAANTAEPLHTEPPHSGQQGTENTEDAPMETEHLTNLQGTPTPAIPDAVVQADTYIYFTETPSESLAQHVEQEIVRNGNG